MFFVISLALIGLFLIYLEFFLPGLILAIGGGVLLFASLLFFQMEQGTGLPFILYLVLLASTLFSVIRFALWQVQSKRKG